MENPELKLGTPAFEKTIFVLKKVPTRANIQEFALQGNLSPEPLDETAWMLPAYLSDDFNLFLIFAPNVLDKWTITCSKVTIRNGNEITAMSAVVPTGSGLNAIAQISKGSAVELLAYFKTLAINSLGYFDDQLWRQA